MFKKILSILKKFIVSVFLIYAYNKMALPLDLLIPINMVTIMLVAILGIPSIFMLICFSLFCV